MIVSDTVGGRSAWRLAVLVVLAMGLALVGAGKSSGQPAAATQLAMAAPGVSTADTTTFNAHGCPLGDFCIWHTDSYSGAPSAEHFVCGTYDVSHTHAGSWVNNQTGGVQVKFNHTTGGVILTSQAAPSELGDFDWTDIASVKICLGSTYTLRGPPAPAVTFRVRAGWSWPYRAGRPLQHIEESAKVDPLRGPGRRLTPGDRPYLAPATAREKRGSQTSCRLMCARRPSGGGGSGAADREPLSELA